MEATEATVWSRQQIGIMNYECVVNKKTERGSNKRMRWSSRRQTASGFVMLTARMEWDVHRGRRRRRERGRLCGSGRNANAFLDALGQLFSQHSNDADLQPRGPSGTIWSTELKQSRKAQSAGQSRESRRQRKGREREREKSENPYATFCVMLPQLLAPFSMSCSHSDMDVNMDSKSAASSRCCLPLKYLTLFANCPLPVARLPVAAKCFYQKY